MALSPSLKAVRAIVDGSRQRRAEEVPKAGKLASGSRPLHRVDHDEREAPLRSARTSPRDHIEECRVGRGEAVTNDKKTLSLLQGNLRGVKYPLEVKSDRVGGLNRRGSVFSRRSR